MTAASTTVTSPEASPLVPRIDPSETMAKATAENFPVASWVLAPAVRAHLLALYGFARAVDDVGDLAEGDRGAQLDWVDQELDEAFAGRPSHPLFARAAATATAVGADRSLLERLVAANRQDQVVSRYASFDDLLGYCELSANPVGRLVLAVLGRFDDRAGELSDRICTGLQLVEHWQDVGEDKAAGRIYLPSDDMDRFSVEETDLDARRASPALRRLLAFETSRARALLVSGAPLVQLVSGRARLAVAGFVGGGLAQLDAIEAASYDVLSFPVKASKWAVFARSLALVAPRTGRR